MKKRKKICKKEKNIRGSRKTKRKEKKMREEEKNTKCLTCKMRTCKIDQEYPCKEHKMGRQ